jgi:hypothetical protein
VEQGQAGPHEQAEHTRLVALLEGQTLQEGQTPQGPMGPLVQGPMGPLVQVGWDSDSKIGLKSLGQKTQGKVGKDLVMSGVGAPEYRHSQDLVTQKVEWVQPAGWVQQVG